ncbi:MAG: sugar transferase [Desertifilum sp.]|nr:sugar transferase [Desertifilum sp.]
MDGICTLCNDRMFDQLVALLNSIEVIYGSQMPVCIFPYDEQTEKIAAEIAKRPQVFIYDDRESIDRWDEFMRQARPDKMDSTKKFRLYGSHRRFCAFDGPFDKFVYMDADILLLDTLDLIFAKLDEYDCVTYDFQFYHPEFVYNVQSPKLLEVFDENRLRNEIFCAGFYASKRGLFGEAERRWLIEQLQAGEAEIFKTTGHDQPVANYMFMRTNKRICNLSHVLPEGTATGCTVTSKHFEEKDHALYDNGNRVTYLHYVGISPRIPEAICAGENLKLPYRDLFLHYRFLHEPEKRPVFREPPPEKPKAPPSLLKRAMNKLKLLR